jgi:hypothetical protein
MSILRQLMDTFLDKHLIFAQFGLTEPISINLVRLEDSIDVSSFHRRWYNLD